MRTYDAGNLAVEKLQAQKRFRFPSRMRILKDDEFREVLSRGKKFSATGLILKCKITGREGPRLGLILAKKKFRRPWTEISSNEGPGKFFDAAKVACLPRISSFCSTGRPSS